MTVLLVISAVCGALTGAQINIWQDHFWLEGDLVVVWVFGDWFDLLGHLGDVVAQPQEVLFVLVFPNLANDFKLIAVVLDVALAFDSEQVLVGDAVDEHDAAFNLEVLCILCDVVVDRVCIVTPR